LSGRFLRISAPWAEVRERVKRKRVIKIFFMW